MTLAAHVTMKLKTSLFKAIGYSLRALAVLVAIPALYFMYQEQNHSGLGETFLGDILRLGVFGTVGSLLRIFIAAIICFGPIGLIWWCGGRFLDRA